jgi:hypothetical protein
MKTLTLEIPEEVYSFLEVRCAIDELRIKEGMEKFLVETATALREGRRIRVG